MCRFYDLRVDRSIEHKGREDEAACAALAPVVAERADLILVHLGMGAPA
jgi:hypothetical protein